MHDMPPRKTPEMTEARLCELLDKHAISYEEWGTDNTKSVQDLLDEITDGEVWLVEDEQGLLRVTNGLGLDVLASVDGKQYRLFEAKQEFIDGTVRRRRLSTSLGEKIKEGEDMAEVTRRALKEELGLELSDVVGFVAGETEACPRDSGSYPGLRTQIILNHAVVQLSPGQFKSEGYIEEQPGRKRVYFEWEIVEE